jgi:adenylate cyclase
LESIRITAKLRVEREDEPPEEVEIGEGLTIGRSTANQLVIRDSSASRHHAEIRRAGGGHRLMDLGSVNGTWVNGRRLTSPVDLNDGDTIEIGRIRLHFIEPEGDRLLSPSLQPSTMETAVAMKKETIIVFVSDIRDYTGMSEELTGDKFSTLVSDWFRASSRLVETHEGVVDKYIGDAVMAYWVVRNPDNPKTEVAHALATARETIELAEAFSERMNEEFPGRAFRVGVGINQGLAIVGNVGAGANPSFTVVGDTVNVAFRLERLAKEQGEAVIASGEVARNASKWHQFKDLGEVEVRGRKEPVHAWAMKF